MPSEPAPGNKKVPCVYCEASILDSTAILCSGLCMPCFMKENNGFKPEELKALKKRRLVNFHAEWIEFKRIVFATNTSALWISQKRILAHYVPILFAEIDGFLKTGKGRFRESPATTKMIRELESIESDKVSEFIEQLRRFHLVLQQEA